MSKLYLPNMAKGFDSEKLKLHIYIIKGPAASLFQESYYDLLKNALRPNGIVCCQGNTILLFMYSEFRFLYL